MKVTLTPWLCYDCAKPFYVKGFPVESTPEPKEYLEPEYVCEQCFKPVYYMVRFKQLSEPEINLIFQLGYRVCSEYWVKIDSKFIYGHEGWSFDPVHLIYKGFGPKTLDECKKEGFNVHTEDDAHFNIIDWNNTVHFADGTTLVSDDLLKACQLFFNPDVRRAIFKSEWVVVDDPKNILHQKQVNCRVEYY